MIRQHWHTFNKSIAHFEFKVDSFCNFSCFFLFFRRRAILRNAPLQGLSIFYNKVSLPSARSSVFLCCVVVYAWIVTKSTTVCRRCASCHGNCSGCWPWCILRVSLWLTDCDRCHWIKRRACNTFSQAWRASNVPFAFSAPSDITCRCRCSCNVISCVISTTVSENEATSWQLHLRVREMSNWKVVFREVTLK